MIFIFLNKSLINKKKLSQVNTLIFCCCLDTVERYKIKRYKTKTKKREKKQMRKKISFKSSSCKCNLKNKISNNNNREQIQQEQINGVIRLVTDLNYLAK